MNYFLTLQTLTSINYRLPYLLLSTDISLSSCWKGGLRRTSVKISRFARFRRWRRPLHYDPDISYAPKSSWALQYWGKYRRGFLYSMLLSALCPLPNEKSHWRGCTIISPYLKSEVPTKFLYLHANLWTVWSNNLLNIFCFSDQK